MEPVARNFFSECIRILLCDLIRKEKTIFKHSWSLWEIKSSPSVGLALVFNYWATLYS